MEYNYRDLDNAVHYILTLHPNVKFTPEDMMNEIRLEDVCPELCTKARTRAGKAECLDDIRNSMMNISTRSGIVYKHGRCQLKENNFDIKKIQNIIKTPQAYPQVKFDEPYENGDSILHILCREGEYELLEELARSFNINVQTFNNKGENLVDVVPPENQEVLRSLVKIMLNQMREQQNSALTEAKMRNTDLMTANSCLSNEIVRLKRQNTNMNNRLEFFYITMIFIIVSAIGYLAFKMYA